MRPPPHPDNPVGRRPVVPVQVRELPIPALRTPESVRRACGERDERQECHHESHAKTATHHYRSHLDAPRLVTKRGPEAGGLKAVRQGFAQVPKNRDDRRAECNERREICPRGRLLAAFLQWYQIARRRSRPES